MKPGTDMPSPSIKRLKLAVILFYLALFVGLALYDERPGPELVREMARPHAEVVEQGNIWMVFLGFTAPEGVSPYAYAERRIQKLQEFIKAGKSEGEVLAAYLAAFGDNKSELSFRGKMPPFYGKKDDGIMSYAAGHPDEVATLCRDNAELLRRYEQLRTYPHYTEPLDYGFSAPFPMFSPLRNTQRARFLQLATKARQGDVAGALAGVREDAEFWRLIARSSRTLISKLIALTALNTDFRFAAELGASRRFNERELKIVHDILRPFGDGEVSLTGTLRGEARFVQRGLELTYRQTLKPWGLGNLLFKPNATRNRMYTDYQEFIRLAELTPQMFAGEAQKSEADKTRIRRIGLPFLYNPAGEFLAVIGQSAPVIQNYIEKGHNQEGLRRLALLKVLARAEGIAPERTQQFLNAHAKELGNPYTGAAMTWNAKKGSISFNSLTGEKPIEMWL
jgi:hypothetical protein